MPDHLSEEQEQIEVIKQWLKDNFLTVILPVIICGLAYVGWGSYKAHQQDRANAGSEVFQTVFELLEQNPDGALTAETKQSVIEKTSSISKEFESSLYADFALLIEAKIDYTEDRINEAQQKLVQVASNGTNDGVKAVASARLAKLLLDKKEYDEALSQVVSTNIKAFESVYAEIRGDIAFAQANKALANKEYTAALDALGPEDFQRRAIIDLKAKATAIAALETVDTNNSGAKTPESPKQLEAEGA